MRESARRVFKVLSLKKLNKLLIVCGLMIGISLLVFFAPLKNEQIDFKKLAAVLNIQCRKDLSFRCFSNFFTSFARDHPLPDSIILLRELQQVSPKTANCHSLAHVVSIAEVEKNPKKWLELFKQVPTRECSYGYFHGVIEGKYRSTPDFKVDNKLIDQVCSEMGSEGSLRSCAHAFGHVLLVQEEGDLETALFACEGLRSAAKSSCFQGIFMENIQRDNLSFHGITGRAVWTQVYLYQQKDYCNQYSYEKRTECWRSLGPAILSVVQRDLDDALLFCQNAPDYSSRRSCSREVLGQNMVSMLASRDDQSIIPDNCSFINHPQEYKECVQDLVGYVLLTSKSYKNRMVELCQNIRSEAAESCLRTVEDYSY